MAVSNRWGAFVTPVRDKEHSFSPTFFERIEEEDILRSFFRGRREEEQEDKAKKTDRCVAYVARSLKSIVSNSPTVTIANNNKCNIIIILCGRIDFGRGADSVPGIEFGDSREELGSFSLSVLWGFGEAAMGSLVELVIARRAVGTAGRAVGGGLSVLEGISTQNLARRHREKKEETTSLSLVATRRPTMTPLGLGNDRRGTAASLVQCTAALGARCQTEGEGQTQTIKNETISVNKVPLESKQMTPKLADGNGGFPPRDGDGGGGGGGGGGGWGQGGFVFWALVLLVGFLRDKELEKPYQQKKPKKMKRPSMA